MKHLDILVLYCFLAFFIQFQGVKLKARENKHIYYNMFNHKFNLYLNNILNAYRKHNNFNYDYEDWEDTFDNERTTQLNNTEETIETSTVTSSVTTNTNIETTSLNNTATTQDTDTVVTNKTSDVATNEETTMQVNVTNETVTENTLTNPFVTPNITHDVISETKLVNLTETEELLQLFASSSTISDKTVPTFHLETYFPGTTFDILNYTMPITTTTKNPFIEEVKETSKSDGYFTSSLIVLFKTLLKKNHEHTTKLLATLNWQIEELNTQDRLLIFGGAVAEVFQSMIQMLAVEPADVMQNHLKYAEYALENRRQILKEDTNVLLDVADTAYIESDIDDIATALKAISIFPNSSESAGDVIRTAYQAFIFNPFVRIQGTARERMLIVELNAVIKRRLYPGQDIQ